MGNRLGKCYDADYTSRAHRRRGTRRIRPFSCGLNPRLPADRAGRVAEASVKETGLRNGAHGADKFGLNDAADDPLEFA